MTTAVRIAHTRAQLARLQQELREDPSRPQPGRVALVPTMGALHAGHAALIAHARAATAGPVVVSIFVNPMQFAPGEDLDRYPRTLEADLDLCAHAGADIVFAPGVDEVYPGGGASVTVDPGTLGTVLEGESRPTHFRGVLTVVAKLFGLVRPDLAVFGEKDYQQLILIRQMSEELCMGVEVVGVPIVREPDGLALSSRNRYLSAGEHAAALALSRALRAGCERAEYGVPAARWAAMKVLKGELRLELDYLALRTVDLAELPEPTVAPTSPTGRTGAGRILVAARVGTTRLIDNMPIDFCSPDGGA